MKYKLMSLQKYADTKHKSPYIYRLKKGKKSLLVLGSKHSNNLKDSQFSLFKREFEKFKPEIIFVEGGWDSASDYQTKSEKDAVKWGEMAFLVFLAKKKNIPILSWEAGEKKEVEFLLKKYTKDELFAHFIIRVIPQYIRYRKPKRYLQREIKSFQRITKWKNFDYSLNNLKSIHKEIFNKNMKFDNERTYNIPPYPIEDSKTIGRSVLNKIAADEMIFRDSFSVRKVISSLKRYNRVLAIMGAGHAVVQEPVYRAYFKSLKV